MHNTATVTLSTAEIEALLDALNDNDSKLLARLDKARGEAEVRHLKGRLSETSALAARLIEARKTI